MRWELERRNGFEDFHFVEEKMLELLFWLFPLLFLLILIHSVVATARFAMYIRIQVLIVKQASF